jgi:hypothetical protein
VLCREGENITVTQHNHEEGEEHTNDCTCRNLTCCQGQWTEAANIT